MEKNLDFEEYHKWVKNGTMLRTYQRILSELKDVTIYLSNNHPEWNIKTVVHPGQLDVSYFAFHPENWKEKRVKIVVGFVHKTFKVYGWVSGTNQKAQEHAVKVFSTNGFKDYAINIDTEYKDYFIETPIIQEVDFNAPQEMRITIEEALETLIDQCQAYVDKI